MNPPGDFTSYPGLAQNLVSQSSFRGLVIEAFAGPGITISNGDANTIAGNHIGMDYTGKIARPNAVGILLSNSTGNTIGGTDSADRNLISGNLTAGIWLLSTRVQPHSRKYVGLDSAGTTARGNGDGLDIRSDYNVISSNVISATAAMDRAIGADPPATRSPTTASDRGCAPRDTERRPRHQHPRWRGRERHRCALPSAANLISDNAATASTSLPRGPTRCGRTRSTTNGGAGIRSTGPPRPATTSSRAASTAMPARGSRSRTVGTEACRARQSRGSSSGRRSPSPARRAPTAASRSTPTRRTKASRSSGPRKPTSRATGPSARPAGRSRP